MMARWLLVGAVEVPETDEWLSPREAGTLARLRFPKRRTEWKLGRFTAKRALASELGIEELHRIEVIAAKDGAPEAFLDGACLPLSLSISHRNDTAVCAWSRRARVGCDLEAIEPRTSRFVEDFFTERERVEVLCAAELERHRRVALTWSAKESALKALRVGLRRDTRSVEVDLVEPGPSATGWQPLHVAVQPEGRRLDGWWRLVEQMVLTVIEDITPAD